MFQILDRQDSLCSGSPFSSRFPLGNSFRGRLTLRRRADRRNPWIFGDHDFHMIYSLLMSAYSLLISPQSSWRKSFNKLQNVPLPYFDVDQNIRHFGKLHKTRYIFGAISLDQWAITLSSKDGCFQAHLLVVFATSLPFPLSNCLGTLVFDLGCFPLDFGP